MSDARISTSVRIASDTMTADQIEGHVCKVPDRRADRGDSVSSRSPGIHQRSFCIYRCPLESDDGPEQHVAWIVEFMGEAKRRLLPLIDQLEIDVRISLSSTSGQAGLAFVASELSLLAELGTQLNIDLYSSGDDDS